ncbi:MAG: YicC family protein [Bacteroidia bacterium]|nr:YicC family protein [Bacteroidia bacterium]
MLLSMTGYGSGKAENTNYSVVVELKSLNSKFLEISFRLPKTYFEQEILLKNQVSKLLLRGKISMNILVEIKNPEKNKQAVNINRGLLETYLNEIQKLQEYLKEPVSFSPLELLNLPGVLGETVSSVDPEEWELVIQATDIAIKEAIKSRTEEGKALQKDVLLRCHWIEKLLEEISQYEDARKINIRNRLRQNLSEIKTETDADIERFEKELIYYLERIDFSEEKVRLKAHIDYFRTTVIEEESNGRKLHFIAQEMGREINTLGAKAYDADIQKLVVRMKEEHEKIREQLNNVL